MAWPTRSRSKGSRVQASCRAASVASPGAPSRTPNATSRLSDSRTSSGATASRSIEQILKLECDGRGHDEGLDLEDARARCQKIHAALVEPDDHAGVEVDQRRSPLPRAPSRRAPPSTRGRPHPSRRRYPTSPWGTTVDTSVRDHHAAVVDERDARSVHVDRRRRVEGATPESRQRPAGRPRAAETETCAHIDALTRAVGGRNDHNGIPESFTAAAIACPGMCARQKGITGRNEADRSEAGGGRPRDHEARCDQSRAQNLARYTRLLAAWGIWPEVPPRGENRERITQRGDGATETFV